MTSAFNISQHLYVSKNHVRELVASGLPLVIDASGEDGKVSLASGDNQTINEQYGLYEDMLDKIINVIGGNSDGEVILSICIRAYDYIPEINFSGRLLARVTQLRASIDVDLINMIEEPQDSG